MEYAEYREITWFFPAGILFPFWATLNTALSKYPDGFQM